MNPQKLRLWLAAVVFVLALGILAASFMPGVRVQQVVPMPPVTLPTPTPSPTPLSGLVGWRVI